MTHPAESIGPLLFFHGHDDNALRLAVLIVQPAEAPAPRLNADGEEPDAEPLLELDGRVVLRYRFTLPRRADTGYRFDGLWYPVHTATDGDLRIAFVSCDGQEHGDLDRHPDSRNVLWQRLMREHERAPFQLVLQGGDQLYADEVLDAHADLQAWKEATRAGLSAQPSQAVRAALRQALFHRYLMLHSAGPPDWLMARVPSLCIWDDHDICDGWGSLPPEQLDARIGRLLFEVAREFFLLFQMGTAADQLPPLGSDPDGVSLGWATHWPGVTFLAPDLRSERRPDRVMGPNGWAALRRDLARSRSNPVFLVSSVPVLGPRLSWVERMLQMLPHQQQYEDDLRDQWQSRAHRGEWSALLRELLALHENGAPVTLLSGEIHLAAYVTMATGTTPMQQLIASGITHPPPPPWYARCLGALAHLGEAPLPGHPIRFTPLPGQRHYYATQRNYLVLERRDKRWSVRWELEEDGPTSELPLGPFEQEDT